MQEEKQEKLRWTWRRGAAGEADWLHEVLRRTGEKWCETDEATPTGLTDRSSVETLVRFMGFVLIKF